MNSPASGEVWDRTLRDERRTAVANPLREQFAETLLERIRSDTHPSGTQMDMLESVASPRMRVAFALHLMDRIEAEQHPSIPMMHRVRRLIDEFGA
jgi:hypothetical protein